jgi:D-tyrosyl-tRNA(Tyr) deacylase
MIALVQRVSYARVEVDGKTVGEIGGGLLILLGVHRNDSEREVDWVARKCANLRVFRDEAGVMNRSLVETQGGALVVSQFTLYGRVGKGNRPSYVDAAPSDVAETLYERFVASMKQYVDVVETGVFGAMMQVELENDGPVTIRIERHPEDRAS